MVSYLTSLSILVLILTLFFLWVMIIRKYRVYHHRFQLITSGFLHTVIVILLIIAINDPKLLRTTDIVTLFFCLDVSESIHSNAPDQARARMNRMTKGMQKEDKAGLIIFGKHPLVEVPLQSTFPLGEIQSVIDKQHSNIHEAIMSAIGKMPQEGKKRIVLFTDGQETQGQSIDAAHLAASLGIEIYPFPLSSWYGDNELYIKDLITPESSPLYTPFKIELVVMSAQENNGELMLLKNDTIIINKPIQLHSGKNILTYTDQLDNPGFFRYKAIINTTRDNIYQNNEGISFTRGIGSIPILYVGNRQSSGSSILVRTLEKQGLAINELVPEKLPGSLNDLMDYQAIILDNVSAKSLSYSFMSNVATYVKNMGGGLILLGGDQSFGAGYYKNTPIEKVMPVFMDMPTDLSMAGLSLIFVIDKSSSMIGGYVSKSKLEMAKIATFSSIEILNPFDLVGILTFDYETKWTVPMTQAKNRQQIANSLNKISSSGGTDMFPALKEAFITLRQTQARKKHVIVLTDGMTEEADFEYLAKAMRRDNISISTVAVGSGSNRMLLDWIARWGGGRSYYTNDPESIPKIFTGETKIVARKLIVENRLQPRVLAKNDILQGIDPETMPDIYGYVTTYAKPGAKTILEVAQSPLLTTWRYGLGRSAAYTSDLTNRWGKKLLLWKNYNQFVSHLVKWTSRAQNSGIMTTNFKRQGDIGTLVVDAIDQQNRFINHLNLQVTITPPSQKSTTIPVAQIAPGRYAVDFTTAETGEYYLALHDTNTLQSAPHITGFGLPYHDEFRKMGTNDSLLQQLAEITGGKIIHSEVEQTNLFTVSPPEKESGRGLWPILVISAAILFLIELLVRKILRW